jgi:hypothetical protein
MIDRLEHLFVVDVKKRLINNTPYDVYRVASQFPLGSVEIVDLRFSAIDDLPASRAGYLFLETAGTWMCFDWNPVRFTERLDYLRARCDTVTVVGPQARALREYTGRAFHCVDSLDFSAVVPGTQLGKDGVHEAWLDPARNAAYNGQTFDGRRLTLTQTFSLYHSMNCPLTCAFCFYADAARTPKASFDHLLAEIRRIRARGCHHFYFMDPNFILSRAQLSEIEALRDSGEPPFTYYCQLSPNLLTKDRMRWLADSGCCGMVIGIENREQILAKGLIEDARRQIELLVALGMMPTLYFMIDGRNDIRDLPDLFDGIPFQYAVLNPAFASDRSLNAIQRGFAVKARLAEQHAALIAELRTRANYIGALAAGPAPSWLQAQV